MDSVEHDEAVVRTEGLTKRFGDSVAVDHLTFAVPAGQIFGLIGPSGCGKTTTVRLLTGVYEPTAGQATVLGSEPIRFNNDTRARIGYMPQQSVLYPNLSVWENLRFTASIYSVSPFSKEALLDALEFVELTDHRHKRVHNISGGMQRRLSLAASLLHEPDLLFLDEPTGGVDPVLRRKFWDHFEVLRASGKTLFVTTQYVGEAAYCDLVGVMMEGRLVIVDSPEGLRHRAFGGEVINMCARDSLDYGVAGDLQEVEGVREVIRRGDTRLRLVVDEASLVTPRVLDWTRAKGIEVEAVEEYKPPFDDVFVRMIEDNARTRSERQGSNA